MQKRYIYIFITTILLSVAFIVYFQTQKTNTKKQIDDKPDNVIGVEISSKEIGNRMKSKEQFLKVSDQKIDKITIRNDVEKKLAQEKIVFEYAKANGIFATEREIANRYESIYKSFNSSQKNNISDDSKFLDQINYLYGITYDEYIEQVKLDILKEKIQLKTNIPYAVWVSEKLANLK